MILPGVQVRETLGCDPLQLSLREGSRTSGLHISLETKTSSPRAAVAAGLEGGPEFALQAFWLKACILSTVPCCSSSVKGGMDLLIGVGPGKGCLWLPWWLGTHRGGRA